MVTDRRPWRDASDLKRDLSRDDRALSWNYWPPARAAAVSAYTIATLDSVTSSWFSPRLNTPSQERNLGERQDLICCIRDVGQDSGGIHRWSQELSDPDC